MRLDKETFQHKIKIMFLSMSALERLDVTALVSTNSCFGCEIKKHLDYPRFVWRPDSVRQWFKNMNEVKCLL